MKTLFTFLLAALAARSFSQAIVPDSTYSHEGIATLPDSRVYPLLTYANCMVQQPDGKVIAGGGATAGPTQIALVRYNTDGMPDNTFGYQGAALSTPLYNSEPVDMALQADGKILVYGVNRNLPADTVFFQNMMVTRHLNNGSLDSSFGTNGLTVFQLADSSMDVPAAIALQSTGKIICAGLTQVFSTQVNETYQALMRLNADGTVDSTFGNAGKVRINVASRPVMTIQPDDKIIIASDSFPGLQVVRLLPNGQPDSTFASDGIANSYYQQKLDETYAVALQPDGKIIVGGKSTIIFSRTAFAMLRLNTNGSVDSTFGVNGRVIQYVDTMNFTVHKDELRCIKLLQDGKILTAGKSYDKFAVHDGIGLARFNADGSRDFGFNYSGFVTTTLGDAADYPIDLDVQPGEKIIFLNHSYLASSGNYFAVARFAPAVATAINPIGYSSLQATVFPNPLVNGSVLQLNLAEPQQLSAALYAIDGKLLYRLFDNRLLNSGTNIINLPPFNLAKGNYVLHVSGENYTATLKIVK